MWTIRICRVARMYREGRICMVQLLNKTTYLSGRFAERENNEKTGI